MENLSTKYNPEQLEEKWYDFWQTKGYFHADAKSEKPPFCVVIPPPNVTSVLHMGHGLNNAIQDVVIRHKRMQGYNTLWMPGTDHAGIATQNVVEKMLAQEGKTRQELGREAFLEKVWSWKDKYGNAIINQLKKIGSSCDWERERFTMDEGLSKAVREAFVRLYEDGLIYKGEYIINWCPRCGTALADEEVEHSPEQGHLYNLKYYVKDSDEYLVVATTRPETLLGDTAVAVHPEDERYKKYIGKTVILPITGREIPVIADEYVDREFGTGALKITPAHDPNDFEIGQKHKLPIINVLHPDATMNEEAGKYENMDRFECRKAIIKDLEELNLVEKIEKHEKSVGGCYRCDTVVEPYVSAQWFVKMKPLAKKAIEVVENGDVDLAPEQWKKVYLNWMNNIRDWCISRQIWWGHRIPAWQCDHCGHFTVKREDPTECEKCGSKHIHQDEDVLDTWFSSWLWPISTLGWPDETPDLATFYPTQFLSTAPEILFFWVARMIMAGLYFKDQIPFSKVFLHSTVCDANGVKMSKSLGNGIDPLEVVKEYGADSLRFTILYLGAIGQRIRLANNSFDIGFKFANKLWNASRFILMNLEGVEIKNVKDIELNDWDKWILQSLDETAKNMNAHMETYRFNDLTNEIYHFVWDKFCDWYVEVSKKRIYSDDPAEKTAALSVLLHVLEASLRLLHPIMPFMSEEIWQKLPNKNGESIMIAAYPEGGEFSFPEESKKIATLQELIYLIRNIRADVGVTPDKKVPADFISKDASLRTLIEQYKNEILSLAKAESIGIHEKLEKSEDAVSAVGNGFEVFVMPDAVLDVEKELERLDKENKKLSKDLERIEKKLNNPQFLEKAPEKIIEKEKAKQQELSEKLEKIQQLTAKLKG